MTACGVCEIVIGDGQTECYDCSIGLGPKPSQDIFWQIIQIKTEPDPVEGWTKTDEDAHRIVKALERNGIKHGINTWKDVATEVTPVEGSWHTKVIVHGPIAAVRPLLKKYPWVHWSPFDRLKCSNYYPRFAEHITQQVHIFLPFGTLLANWSFYHDMLWKMMSKSYKSESPYWGVHNLLFVRPDNNIKSFAAGVMGWKDLNDMVGVIEPDSMVVAAVPQTIHHEWRVLVIDGTPITGSMYRPTQQEGMPPLNSYYYKELWEAGRDYLPSAVFFDFAETDEDISLLEISGVNCAGLYEMDHDKFVIGITKQARKEYDHAHD